MKKMNNKGFSLVELIIVIAIMAILIVVLAPQYLRYVERARNSTDLQNATTIVDAIQIYAADPEANPAITTSESGTVISIAAPTGTSQITPPGGATSTGIAQALTQANVNVANMHCSSRTAWTAYQITVNVNSDGSVTFVYAGQGEATAGDFATRMAGH